MESLMELLGAGASVASGGIFGLIGSGIGVWAKMKQAKADRLWQEKEWAHESLLLDKQMQVAQAETENEIAITSSKGSWSGLNESIRADMATKPSSGWASDIKALFRPFLTTALVGCTMYIIHSLLNGDLRGVISASETTEILRYAIYSVVFATSAAITWWFGDRALTPPHLKHR